MNKKDYPKPAYTADNCVILVPDDPTEELERILLIVRKNDPFKGFWALPGGYVNEGEASEDASRREASEEVGIDLPGMPTLIGIFDSPGRDPRGWTVAAAYRWYLPSFMADLIKAGDDAADVRWFPVDSLPENLAFDHLKIIQKAINYRG